MPIYVKGDKALLFIHIPKTGGTTIGDALLASGWRRSFQASPLNDPDSFHLRRVSPQHYHAELLKATLKITWFDVRFCVVRHPIDRFRSEYAMRRREPHLGAAHLVEEWALPRLDRCAQQPSFLDNHFRPQSEFIVPETVVYRYEDGVENAVDDLRDTHGVDVGAAVWKRSSRGSATRLSSQDVEISDRLEERLREFYRRDFRRFGYR